MENLKKNRQELLHAWAHGSGPPRADKIAGDCRSRWVQKNGARKSMKIRLVMSAVLFHIFIF